MQTNKSEHSIDFINRDVKDFPATETRETFHHVQFEDIAMIMVFALIILVFLSQFFPGNSETDGIEQRNYNGERQPAYIV